FNDTATTEIYTLSLHDALPISCNSPRRLSLPSDRAPWCAVDPALLRRIAGWQRRLHLRRDAHGDTSGSVAVDRVPARARRLRRQGRAAPAAHMAARGPSRGALARIRTDERGHAQDGDLRPA